MNAKNAKQKLQEMHISQENKMVTYKCFNCNQTIKGETVRKRIRCPYCGSKILYKPRLVNTKIKAV